MSWVLDRFMAKKGGLAKSPFAGPHHLTDEDVERWRAGCSERGPISKHTWTVLYENNWSILAACEGRDGEVEFIFWIKESE